MGTLDLSVKHSCTFGYLGYRFQAPERLCEDEINSKNLSRNMHTILSWLCFDAVRKYFANYFMLTSLGTGVIAQMI